jgi:predicted dinucleotide-binding enzyme
VRATNRTACALRGTSQADGSLRGSVATTRRRSPNSGERAHWTSRRPLHNLDDVATNTMSCSMSASHIGGLGGSLSQGVIAIWGPQQGRHRRRAHRRQPGTRAGSVAEAAAHGQAVVVSVPSAALDAIAREVDVAGKVLDDTTTSSPAAGSSNCRPGSPPPRSTPDDFGEAALVKTFNPYTSGSEAAVGNRLHPRPVAIFLGGQGRRAKTIAAELVRDAGFEPVHIGG